LPCGSRPRACRLVTPEGRGAYWCGRSPLNSWRCGTGRGRSVLISRCLGRLVLAGVGCLVGRRRIVGARFVLRSDPRATLGLVRVFSDRDRSYAGWADEDESLMFYLERSARPAAARVRALLDAWFEHYPASNRASLRGRLWSKDERDQNGAFWELYLHQVFLRADCNVAVAPDGSTDPDFLIADGQGAYIVEATIAGPPEAEVAAAKRKAALRKGLGKAKVGGRDLNLRVKAIGRNAAPASRICSWIEMALRGRDPVNAPEELIEVATYKRDGWDVRVLAFPRRRPRAPDASANIMEGPNGFVEVRTHEVLCREIHQKASKLRGLDKPLLLAVNLYDPPPFSTDDDSVRRALFGTETVTYTISDDLQISHAEDVRVRDGVWWDRKTRSAYNLLGVITGSGVAPPSIASAVPTVWSNPHALRAAVPLPPRLPFGRRWIGGDGRPDETQPGSPRRLLDVDDFYPHTPTVE